MPASLWWKLPIVVGVWFGVLWYVVNRVTRDRPLRRLLLVSYTVRIFLGLAFYLISYWHGPLLRGLQIMNGFWAFGLDANAYHIAGAQIAEAWQRGIDLPDPGLGIEYFAVVAVFYTIFGPSPLYPILFNSLLAASTGLLAYLISRRLLSQRAARIAAALVSFWPSTLIWSSQLLKDSLSSFLVFTVLWLIMTTLSQPSSPRHGHPARWVLLAAAVVLLTRLRFYLGSAFSLATVLVCAPLSVTACAHRRISAGLRGVAVALVVVLATLFARTLNTIKLLSPPHPETGHFRLAVEYWHGGEVQQAEQEFRQAITLNGRYKEAYLGLAALQIQTGRLAEANKVYAYYLEGEEPEKRLGVKRIIARIYAEQGNRNLTEGRAEDAVSAYESALTFDASSAAIYVNLGMALAQQQKFETAREILGRAWSLAQSDEERQEIQIIQEHVIADAQRKMAGETLPLTPAVPSPYGYQTPVSLHDSKENLTALATEVFSLKSHGPAASPVSPVNRAFPQFQQLEDSVFQIDDQALKAMRESRPESMGVIRQGFVATKGNALIDPWAQISSPRKLVTYLPRALAIGFFAPFPWQWFDTRGSTGVMRTLAGLEMLLLYFLMPAVLSGVWSVLKQRRPEGVLLVAFVLLTAVPLSLVVANVGTLFRLRLSFLLPLLLLAAGDPLGCYVQGARWLRARGTRSSAGSAAGPGGSSIAAPQIAGEQRDTAV